MRILIAEDEDVLRGVMVRVLSGAGHDVTDTPNAEEALVATLVRDEVTGLYNPRHFREVLETELSRCRRHERMFSLIVSQLPPPEPDGGSVEDSVVRAAANVIAARCRTSDVAGRYGVSGFALVLPETDRKGATAFGEAIRREVAAAYLRPGRPTTLCVGIATFPDDGDDASRLLDRADEAMCRAIASSLEATLLNAGDGRSR